ncbi:hypothetical protein [Paenibacillus hexagrammi]|uniref:Uncharacterized protein n=1 Tax=Paenibacillus hexagrammi TaxID=2908839 RepID=A0ABY3SCG2_9BACL|nr:hypothetical protein [Paenibacillus sp. YPD9-1]UJF31170.1 hypothetical protein L0M14_14855 [Paenibacillus sp. YPD9-1]
MNDPERSLVRTAPVLPIQEDEDTYLPPRKAVHPSEEGKWTRIFYATLLWLFVALVIGLTVWGIRYY